MRQQTKFKWIRADLVRSWLDFENEINAFLNNKEVIYVTTLDGGIGIGIFYKEVDKSGN